ncbi:SAICAR synthase-like protein [Lentinus brumalis]|uniref:Kinase n=1 Tax=Lentinus brumalis TaxID=2498619 RepID=A0A371D4I4_9APHY|nr:SAICAR synthase-like protein [Polyporus brumalis]
MSAVEHAIPLESQVGGHAGVMTSEDGSLLIKPALAAEVAFYQSVTGDPSFAPLRPYVPKFYGTLRLEGKLDESQPQAEGEPLKVVQAPGEKESLVLENLSHSFLKPNILDVKLGTVLYDDSASEEKRARMEKTARETTSLETGVRLTGFQVYDLATGSAVNTPKSYGKSIKVSDLPDGITRFFPLATDTPPEPAVPSVEGETADATPLQGTGLPADILLPVLESLREDIADIRAALADVHMRMVGGSLLVIYEADWARAREGLKWLEEEEEDDEDDEDEGEDNEESSDSEKKRVGPPYLVKLIDFAHTKIVPGIGPDEGVLKGVDTVLGLLDGRIEQVKAASPTSTS